MPSDKEKRVPPQIKIELLETKLDHMKRKGIILENDNKRLKEENRIARAKLHEVKVDMKTSLTNETKASIQAILKCSDAELKHLTSDKSLKELEVMLDSMIRAQPKAKEVFTSMRAGASTVKPANDIFTVGDLFNKSRKEISQMEA